jgi:hypothetical protein
MATTTAEAGASPCEFVFSGSRIPDRKSDPIQSTQARLGEVTLRLRLPTPSKR